MKGESQGLVFCSKQKTAFEMRISDGSSDVCSSDLGEDIDGFTVGGRVVSNGPHADIVRVPHNLCGRIPDGVDDEAAAFTVVASIGLQGVRLAGPTLGEVFVVTGAGLIGLLTIQLLRAQG